MSDWEVDSDYDGSVHHEADEVIHSTPPKPLKAPTSIWSFDDLAAEQDDLIHMVADLLTLSLDEAFLLLRKYRWQMTLLQETWFEQGEMRIRKELNIGKPWLSLNNVGQQKCLLCLEIVQDCLAMCSGHWGCEPCWVAYLINKAEDGRAALEAHCPGIKCNVPLHFSLFPKLISDPDLLERYRRFRVQSIVDDGVDYKWCPNTEGCKLAIKASDRLNPPLLARCTCGFSSCWRCSRESHEPASCLESDLWERKNSSESENVTWILAHTKKCPKCGKPIEKNQGCNHMHCPSQSGGCGFHFCWTCLKNWEAHGGDPYSCNIYRTTDVPTEIRTAEQTREQAKNELNRYMFFFERFTGHQKAKAIAVKELNDLENKVQRIHDHFGFNVDELQFLKEAMIQILDCRRVLKWTYVFGYYLADTAPSKPLFEYLQKNLEQFTDRLHEYIEKDLDQSCLQLPSNEGDDWPTEFDKVALSRRFSEFRAVVTNYYSVTGKFMSSVLADLKSSEGLLSESMRNNH